MSQASILSKNLFAFGVIADLLPNVILGSYYEFVYNDILKLPQFYTSTAFTIFIVFKACLLLTLGIYIGKTTISLKKIYIGSLFPFILGAYFIWSPPDFIQQSTPLIRVSFLLFAFFLYGFGFIVFFLTKSNIFNLFSKEDRTSILGFQQIYFVIGLCGSIVLPPIIAGDGWKNLHTLSLFIITIGIISPLGAFLAFPTIKPKPPPSENKKTDDKDTKKVGIFRSLLTPFLLSNNFIYFVLAVCSIQVGFELLTSNNPLVLKYVVPGLATPQVFFGTEFSGKTLIAIAQMSGQVGMLASTKYWLYLTKKKGSITTWKISALLFALATLLQYLFINESIVTFAFLQIINGISCSALIFLNPLIISEFGELFERKQPGKCSASQLQGVSSVAINIAAMLRGNLNSIVLSAGNYIPGESQPQSAITSILLLAFLLPQFMFIISAFSMKHFPKDDEKKEQ